MNPLDSNPNPTLRPVVEEHRERWGKKGQSFHVTLQPLFAELAELEWPPLLVAHRFHPVPRCEAISGLKKSEQLRGDWLLSGNQQPLPALLLCSVPRCRHV